MNTEKFRLKVTSQCKKCPWRVKTEPCSIPYYSVEGHKAGSNTITDPNNPKFSSRYEVMTCHVYDISEQVFCVGWLNNQLGSGNNINLRRDFMFCENIKEIKLDGEQHLTFEDTLPKE